MCRVRVAFDALTPKQARIAATLYWEGRKRGIDVVVTCREYDHTRGVLEMEGVEAACVGGYGVTTEEKLRNGLARQMALVDLYRDVDVVASFASPDASRVGFGLGKPVVTLNDTAHADAVNRLTVPLSTCLIVPKALPRRAFERYGCRRIVTFNGVFELMWIRRFTPKRDVIEALGLAEGEYVVVRPSEVHASYYPSARADPSLDIAREAARMGYRVVYLPRYPDQRVDWALMPPRTVDFLSLAYYSAMVVTGGATMALEAALLGTPALSLFPLRYYTDMYLEALGAPLYRCFEGEQCMRLARNMLAAPFRRRPALDGLDDPTNVILNVISSLGTP